MIPSVSITKSDGNTGVVKPSPDGNLAIIGTSQKGSFNVPSSFTRQIDAYGTFGEGNLVEAAAYDMAVAQKPVVLIRGNPSTAAAYGTVTNTGPGTATPAADTSVHPYDDADILITFVAGGALGTAGITYTYSRDGGFTTSGVQALGTALTLLVPNTNAQFTLGTSTQTILAGQTIACSVTGPKMTNSDLLVSLEALRTYGGAWDAILYIGGDADATTVSDLDTWLAAREAEGKYRTALCNTVKRDPSTQTEAQYATAMATAASGMSSIRVVVGADGEYLTSLLSGVRLTRYVATVVAARGMAVDIARDVAFVADGALPGVQIADDQSNPKFHDEALFPGLDDLRLTTLRSFPGRAGVYVNNALLISPSGSDYVYWQHARVMNEACEIAFQLLSGRLSQGINKDVATGFIAEEDAAEIEGLVNAQFGSQLVTPRRCSGAKFVLSRNDNLTSNQGATLTGQIQVSRLAYVKKFAVTSKFVKTIAVTAGS